MSAPRQDAGLGRVVTQAGVLSRAGPSSLLFPCSGPCHLMPLAACSDRSGQSPTLLEWRLLSVLVGLTQLRFWAQEGPLRHPGSPHQGWGERSSSAFLHCAPRNFGCWAGGELKGVGGAGGLRHL